MDNPNSNGYPGAGNGGYSLSRDEKNNKNRQSFARKPMTRPNLHELQRYGGKREKTLNAGFSPEPAEFPLVWRLDGLYPNEKCHAPAEHHDYDADPAKNEISLLFGRGVGGKWGDPQSDMDSSEEICQYFDHCLLTKRVSSNNDLVCFIYLFFLFTSRTEILSED